MSTRLQKAQRSKWAVSMLFLPWVLLLALALYHRHHQQCVPSLDDGPVSLTAQLESFIGEPWREANGLPSGSITPAELTAPASCSAPPPPMVFLHLPKTGGTSVVSYLTANLAVWCSEVQIEPSLTFTTAVSGGAVERVQAQVDLAKRNCSFSHLRAGPEGDARPVYAAMVLGQGFKLQHILGHMPYGYCRLVDQGCTYVTMLREPVQRLASHWGYLRHRHPELLQSACGDACHTLSGFAEALASKKKVQLFVGLDNLQTRMLAGDGFFASMSGNKVCKFKTAGCDISAPMVVDRAMLDTAKANLMRHFRVVGLLEDLRGFMDDMDHAFCFKTHSIPGLNRLGTGKRTANSSDAGVLKLMRHSQGLDIELYAFAKQLIAGRRAKRKAST